MARIVFRVRLWPRRRGSRSVRRGCVLFVGVFLLSFAAVWWWNTHQRTLQSAIPPAPRNSEAHDACREKLRTVQDIRHCHSDRVPPVSDPRCLTIETWRDVQHCLLGRRSNSSSIREVHILGERNSGTKFITSALQQCFPKSLRGIKVHRDLIRPKHFFQPLSPEEHDFSHSLVIIVVRDPVEWMAAMRELPYHSPHHVAGFAEDTGAVLPLPWREFVARPWAPTETAATERRPQEVDPQEGPVCTYRFRRDEVRPCRLDNVTAQGPPWHIPLRKWRGYAPVYELSPSTRRPYDHLLQLRADKMVHWILQLPLLLQNLGGFLVVRYDDVLRHGTAALLQQVQVILHGTNETNCTVIPPQPQRIGKRHVPDDFREWIEQNLDPATERLVGYR